MYSFGSLLYLLQAEPNYLAKLTLTLSNAEIDGQQMDT